MTKEIPLTRGMVALVDDDDYDWLMQWKWAASQKGYAVRNERYMGHSRGIIMHRVILGTPSHLVSDHIDGNKLNNTRANLRVCTRRDNNRNQHKRSTSSSQYKGVYWQRNRRTWNAMICVDRQSIHLGVFQDELEAARAYDAAARTHFGEFACTNFEVQP